jgi:hypothetical protein
MLLAQRWLMWKEVPSPQGGKPRKIPYYIDGTPRRTADTFEDWARLASFADACAAIRAGGGLYVSPAFALGPDGSGCYWQGIDFDNIAENGLSDLELVTPGYVETSPSGLGIHAIGYGKYFPTLGHNGTGIEAYASGRYFTFTGKMCRDCPLMCLADFVSHALAPRHKKLSGERASSSSAVHVQPRVVTDLRSALGYMRADEYQLWISMGHALHELGETGRSIWLDWSMSSKKFDPNVAGSKWDTFKPSKTGYQAVFAEAQRHGWVNPASNVARTEVAGLQDGFKFKFARQGAVIEQVNYLIEPWMPSATVVGFYGRGEAGKSSFAAQLCAAASSVASTLWITSEERRDHILRRHIACGGEEGTLAVVDAMPTEIDPKTGKATASSFDIYRHLEPALTDLQRDSETRIDRPVRVIVLDAVVALVTWGRGEHPNDDAAVKRLIAFLFGVSERYGVTIVILGHLNKSSGHEHVADAVAGSAAWTNSVRLAYMFVKDAESEGYEGFVRTVKSNTGTHFGAPYRTVPVFTLLQRPDGKDDVLCGVQLLSSIVWGDLALREMMASDDDPFLKRLERKREKIQLVVDGVLSALRLAGSTTRRNVETSLGEKVNRRHWQEVERILVMQHAVQHQSHAHNERLYFFAHQVGTH